MNKVWNPNNNDTKILKFLCDFKEGARRGTIERYCAIKTSTLYKRLNILIDKGVIYNENQVWKIVNGQVKFVESLLHNDKKVWELHNPSIVVKLLDVPKWWSPKGYQMKRKLMMLKGYQFQQVRDFGKNGSNPYIQLKSDRHVIQMYPESVIIIFRKRYYSNINPYDVAIDFTNDFYDIWNWFEEKMRFKFFKDGVPQGILRGHDYNKLNDWFSNKIIKKTRKRIKVDIGDGRCVWYDLSEPLGRESNTPELQEIMQKDIKDKVLNKPLLNSELQDLVGSLTKNQLEQQKDIKEFAKQLNRHIPAYEGMAEFTKLLFKEVKELKKEIRMMRNNKNPEEINPSGKKR